MRNHGLAATSATAQRPVRPDALAAQEPVERHQQRAGGGQRGQVGEQRPADQVEHADDRLVDRRPRRPAGHVVEVAGDGPPGPEDVAHVQVVARAREAAAGRRPPGTRR